MDFIIDIGGRPGYDCNGFCKFCYFKNIKKDSFVSFGCKYCLPFKKGCQYCTYGIKEYSSGFKPLKQVLSEIYIQLKSIENEKNLDSFHITGGGDISCYPYLLELVDFLSELNYPIKIGYTSGKGFSIENINSLLKYNISEINYSLFSSSYKLRKEYLNDNCPWTSLKKYNLLCDNCKVYTSILLIKGINDGDVLTNTLNFIESSKSRDVLLMRFSNFIENGLILNNTPILNGIKCHTPLEFKEIIYNESIKRPNLRISGTPIGDPKTNAPFAIIKDTSYLKKLPVIKKRATIITGSIASFYLKKLFSIIGNNLVNVIGVKKEIACLITENDLNDINLKYVQETVFVPGRCLIHESKLKSFFSSDGINRIVRRGPNMLTVDGEISISMSKEEVLNFEVSNLSSLIDSINTIGT